MLYELFAFTGTLSISLMIIGALVILIAGETEDLFCWPVPIVGILIYTLFTQPPTFHWGWFVGYFVLGLIWFFVMFFINLTKIKKYLKANPDFWYPSEERMVQRADHLDKDSDFYNQYADKKIWHLYQTEPSVERFLDRVLCWPLLIIKFCCADLTVSLYESIADYLLNFKKRYLKV